MTTPLTEVTLIGVFEKRQDAQRAIRQLHEAGFRHDKVGFLAKGVDKAETIEDEVATGALAGAAVGAAGGAALGMGMVAGAIPIIGPVLTLGTLGTVLLNAAGGAAIAGLTGALAAWGISEDDATFYQSEVQSGKYLVSVEVSNGYESARRILENNNARLRGVPHRE